MPRKTDDAYFAAEALPRQPAPKTDDALRGKYKERNAAVERVCNWPYKREKPHEKNPNLS